VFQVIKAGFVFSGKAGSGLVIARLPDGSWSAPSCIATGGLGWGLQVGADITDFVIVLNSEDSVRAFSMGGNVTIGGNISAAVGPIGTGGAVQASLAPPRSDVFVFQLERCVIEIGRSSISWTSELIRRHLRVL
jgi:lipid-binding SYLF domain-containing protein